MIFYTFVQVCAALLWATGHDTGPWPGTLSHLQTQDMVLRVFWLLGRSFVVVLREWCHTPSALLGTLLEPPGLLLENSWTQGWLVGVGGGFLSGMFLQPIHDNELAHSGQSAERRRIQTRLTCLSSNSKLNYLIKAKFSLHLKSN